MLELNLRDHDWRVLNFRWILSCIVRTAHAAERRDGNANDQLPLEIAMSQEKLCLGSGGGHGVLDFVDLPQHGVSAVVSIIGSRPTF
jgi:hypothetical protein